MLEQQWHPMRLLACLPLAPVAVLAPFLNGAPSTVQRHTRALIEFDLVGSVEDPRPANGRPRHLLYLTGRGLQAAARDGAEPSLLLGSSPRAVAR
jgi:predicted ArsR family transcriptional regulator